MAQFRFLFFFCLSALITQSLCAQLNLNAFPENLQFLARNRHTNQAFIKISGENQYPIATTLLRFQDNQLHKSWQFEASSSFTIEDTLSAGLSFYHYKLYLGPNILLKADSLVVGVFFYSMAKAMQKQRLLIVLHPTV